MLGQSSIQTNEIPGPLVIEAREMTTDEANAICMLISPWYAITLDYYGEPRFVKDLGFCVKRLAVC